MYCQNCLRLNKLLANPKQSFRDGAFQGVEGRVGFPYFISVSDSNQAERKLGMRF